MDQFVFKKTARSLTRNAVTQRCLAVCILPTLDLTEAAVMLSVRVVRLLKAASSLYGKGLGKQSKSRLVKSNCDRVPLSWQILPAQQETFLVNSRRDCKFIILVYNLTYPM